MEKSKDNTVEFMEILPVLKGLLTEKQVKKHFLIIFI